MASPVTIKEADLGFPQQLIDLTDYLKSFKTAEDEPIQVFINVTKYKPQTSLNLQNAANGAVNEMKSKADVSDFDYTERSENISGFPAIDQTGSFSSPGNKKIEFRDLIIMNDHKMYQVAILYQQSDSIGREVARRMIKSLAISN